MSSPSYRMTPALGGSCNRMSLEVVVLPHPDSPIRPSVSPGWIARSTSSTAFTQPILRCHNGPVLTGKYFCRLSSSSNGADILLLHRLVGVPAFCSPFVFNLKVPRLFPYGLLQCIVSERVLIATP